MIIGVAGSKRQRDWVEQKLKTFIKDQGTKMEYRVAYESGGRSIELAAGQNGIPSPFIVDHEGKLAYIGHPMGMDGAGHGDEERPEEVLIPRRQKQDRSRRATPRVARGCLRSRVMASGERVVCW